MIFSSSSNIKETDVDLFIQFSYEHGYLNVKNGDRRRLELKISNFELHNKICKALFSIDFFIKHYNFDQASMNNFIESLKCISQNGREGSFVQSAQAIKNFYYGSIIILTKEFEFQAHLFYLIQRGFPKVFGKT